MVALREPGVAAVPNFSILGPPLKEMATTGPVLVSEDIDGSLGSRQTQYEPYPAPVKELDNAIIAALDARTDMSRKALNSPEAERGILDILLEDSPHYQNRSTTPALQQTSESNCVRYCVSAIKCVTRL